MHKLAKEKGEIDMTEKEQKILETFADIIPKLSEMDKERLLMFGEGMRFKIEQSKPVVSGKAG